MLRIALGKASMSGAPIKSHEAGEADERDPPRAQFGDERAIEVVARGEPAVLDDDRLNARLAGAVEPGGVRAIGDDDANPRIEPPLRDGVDECLQIAPPPRDEHADRSGVRPRSFGAGLREWRGV
jgi:hypothetical protein